MFKYDFFALLLVALSLAALIALRLFKLNKERPALYFSDLKGFKSIRKGWKERLYPWSRRLFLSALSLFVIAFIDPHLMLERKIDVNPKDQPLLPPTEGIAVYLILDQSGSMNEEIVVMGPDGLRERITKVSLLKQVTAQFVNGDTASGMRGLQGDLLGLVEFARTAHVVSPLTLDHKVITDELARFHTVDDPDKDGTAIGYAIYKTANLIAATRHFAEDLQEKGQQPAYTIKNTVMVLVTDGFQDPSYLDKGNRLRTIELDEAAQYAKKQGVKLYIINVEPKLTSEEFAPQRRQMERIAELTGGKFYLISSSKGLSDIYREIDQLEKNKIWEQKFKITKPPIEYERYSFYPFLIFMGLMALLGAIILETLIVRPVP